MSGSAGGRPAAAASPPPRLAALAAAHRVATSYEDYRGRTVAVAADTVRATLEALGVDPDRPAPGTPEPDCLCLVAGRAEHRLVGDGLRGAQLVLEDGTRRDLASTAGALDVPADLPPGYHELLVSAAGRPERALPVVVAPARLPAPARRRWGWMAQLYALRSAGSWAMGDYADLATLLTWAGGRGADLLLVNPLGAGAPTLPQQPSPYSPSSRRFHSPLYLRPQQLAAYRFAAPDVRDRVDALAAGLARGELIDRDAVWAAKREALELLAADPLAPPPAGELRRFATYCAVAEVHGADWRRWPAGAERDADPARVAFHAWLQECCAGQLDAAQAAARAAGMDVGVVHDLPVGVDPGGADAWALQDVLATGVSVGAPADSFNQQGQDWALPPWHPRRLAEAGYQPFRQVVAAGLGHGGGLRVDHVMGLFRLWWVLPGRGPAQGTYVGYDPEGMLGVLALEASRAGALVVGEDLGTVAPQIGTALSERGVLGSTVLWFADGPPQRWRRAAAASISTHDLPTAAGWLAGEHVRIRAELGLLGRPEAEERAAWEQERRALLAQLAAAGSAGDSDPVLGMHALLAASPSQVVLASLADAVGDLRQPNLPSTVDTYPNWRLPLADGSGAEVGLEAALAHPGVGRVSELLAERVAGD